MRTEIDQIKGLILDSAKTVQTLGEKVERQCYTASSCLSVSLDPD